MSIFKGCGIETYTLFFILHGIFEYIIGRLFLYLYPAIWPMHGSLFINVAGYQRDMNRLYVKGIKSETMQNSMVSLGYASNIHQYYANQSVRNESLVRWFPMRVTYHRELRIKTLLDSIGVENFLPMHYELVETKKEGKKRILLPAIHNLVFVRSTQEFLTELKMTREEFAPMRYIMKRPLVGDDGKGEIMCIPDYQMENFMRVASLQDERVIFLENNEYINKIGQRVRVVDGCFSGVEGVIKRINKNKRIVVQLEGIAAVAIAFVPAKCLTLLSD